MVTLRDITEAHRKERARDLFVTVTSHELRTPVTVIKGYAGTLVNHWDLLDEQARRDAATRLGQRAGELARLVERLLTAVGDGSVLAQQASGVPFDLRDALLSAIDELPGGAARAGTPVAAAGLPPALGDRASIATVVSELVTNAAKYSPSRCRGARSRQRRARYGLLQGGATAGTGCDSEHVERAFERFWQGDSGDSAETAGWGWDSTWSGGWWSGRTVGFPYVRAIKAVRSQKYDCHGGVDTAPGEA